MTHDSKTHDDTPRAAETAPTPTPSLEAETQARVDAALRSHGAPEPTREVFCNRTLNLRGIKAIGYDMDYTLIHYHVREWEGRAYHYTQAAMIDAGWPVGHLRFDPQLVTRGLVLDLDHGNLVKANRFGYVKRAAHGTEPLAFDAQRRLYARTLVDLGDPRWLFLNTLFSLSEGCLYAQLVELFDAGQLPAEVRGYADLYRHVKRFLDGAHMEGRLKAEIRANPERFVDLDEELPRALMDQRAAGKRLVLITNSEWSYTRAMMAWCFDRFLPGDTTWRDLFELVVSEARKPRFFEGRNALFEVVDEARELMRPAIGPPQPGKAYVGGSASDVESALGLSGSEILYVGDHIYADVHVTKSLLRWRTAAVLRELESEISDLHGFAEQQTALAEAMDRKAALELALSRTQAHRRRKGDDVPAAELRATEDALRQAIAAIDAEARVLAVAASRLHSARWGLLMRTGNDKSLLMRMLERHADIYTSRVSNLLHHGPDRMLRSTRSSLPHDTQEPGATWTA